MEVQKSDRTQRALFAGGCFWCLEALYEQIPGVLEARSGYCGGSSANPTYEEVCTGLTGHAETVELTFNPKVVTYRELVDLFWQFHDPTTLNRQGADIGTQYRSAIFVLDAEQEAIARQSMSAVQAAFDRPILTSIEPAGTFWPAEEWHQDYYRHNPDAPYCRFVIAPKLDKVSRTLHMPESGPGAHLQGS